ncbi:precorrin-3B C(17)-methyltransferase [Coralliovum pocilloporae]|uniref:precorrin-3B C(17)-methyltransferase n=1 Tax=Coralliovum pocilloporae TaxID=3066369 RepID=UPI0033071F2E
MDRLTNPAIVVLTQSAVDVAKTLHGALNGSELHLKTGLGDADQVFSDTTTHLQSLFKAGQPIIALCASGIVIRALASLLDDKWQEPPVLSVARDGGAVVPLLGGHRGANDLAQQIAGIISGTAAITTAGECRFKLALDTPPAGWELANKRAAGPVMAKMLDGAPVRLEGALPWIEENGLASDDSADLVLKATDRREEGDASTLVYHTKTLVLGLGCERGAGADEVIALAEQILSDNNLAPQSLAAIASIDVKADEAAIHQAAAHFGVEARFFPAARLEEETSKLANPSDVVFSEVGCHGVSEGAALAGAGQDGDLIAPKIKSQRATAAVARAPEPLDTDAIGRIRGHLSVVGIGPGQAAWRTPEATRLVAEAEELVGYGLYIDLLGDLAAGKERSDFPLGGEEDRCRYALEQAGTGKNVALICSGDAGIYAMGALVMELLDRDESNGGVSSSARRVSITNAPGVSALQAASARAGALLGHDFCTISLSDLLTPWETIEQRLKAAAEGDFVVAFYNPVSMRRRTQLARAREILLEKRPADTPVVLASNLGRPTEELKRRTLGSLEVDEVDMLTVVLVGSSQSQTFDTGSGGWHVYTPRGYAKKIDAPSSSGDANGEAAE